MHKDLYKLLCELQAHGEYTIARGEVLGMDKEARELLLKAQHLIDAARCKAYEKSNTHRGEE